jgi:uncharacterized membrane protein
MNEADRTELARLKEQQARLERELKSLGDQVVSFERRLAQSSSAESPLRVVPRPAPAASAVSPVPTGHILSPIPPPIIAAAPNLQTPRPGEPARSVSAEASSIPVPPPLAVPPYQAATARSFEMRLGTFWLVRVGIVMVLTGLVFFGNLAYHNYISKLGPGGKVCLLYLASGVLLGAGWWWQRRAVKGALRNYAQVVFAGGLGALYFTTYAAHHLERLQVIRSAWLDGLLLLLCAGFMVWAAERKRSEVLAFFAVGLAYYSSIITRVGYFTLVSNLVLSMAAVFFLLRNRWAALSFGSLAATYAAYGFWRFFDGANWHWASPEAGLWSGTVFLMLYWAVFTSAVFLSRDEKFSGQNRASFLTFNNGAFFTLFVLTMLQVHHGGFWRFALCDGAVLLALSAAAGRVLKDEPLTGNMYLTQGLLLVTVGLISKFAGLQLALILATESVLLLILGQQRKNLVLRTGAYIAGVLAVGWGMDGMKQFDSHGLWLAVGLGVLMMANAVLLHRELAKNAQAGAMPPSLRLRPQPGYFVVLALVVWLVATWNNTNHDAFPLYVAIEALALSFSVYFLRVPEVTVFGQGFMVLAQAAWFFNWVDQSPILPWWNPALIIGASLVLSHWWPRQTMFQPRTQSSLVWPALYGLGINLVLFLFLVPKTAAPGWIVTTSLLALFLTVYGVVTRAWFVAACAQLFVAVSVVQFGFQLWNSKPPLQFPLAPIAALGLLSFGAVEWFRRRPDADERVSEPLLQLALIYRWVALVLSITWICDYVPARERIWLLALLGLWIFLWSGLRRSQEALLFGAAYTATALTLFWLPLIEAPTVYFPNLLVIVVLLAQRQIARRLPDRYPLDPGIHNAVILVGALSLWLFVSRWVLEIASGFYLTASWSLLALALFAIGLGLRERMYRWVGLGVLACALGRVVIFDVWKLETVYRILSFMALGIVLLVLGFIYSKYQEKIKEWL